MNFDNSRIANDIFAEVENMIDSGQAQTLIETGAGLIEKQGDTNYIRAVLAAKTLEEVTGAQPTITEIENGRYKISWYDTELKNAQNFFIEYGTKAINQQGEPSPVVIDFLPVIRPVAIRYGAPVLLGSAVALFGLGYIYRGSGRKRKR